MHYRLENIANGIQHNIVLPYKMISLIPTVHFWSLSAGRHVTIPYSRRSNQIMDQRVFTNDIRERTFSSPTSFVSSIWLLHLWVPKYYYDKTKSNQSPIYILSTKYNLFSCVPWKSIIRLYIQDGLCLSLCAPMSRVSLHFVLGSLPNRTHRMNCARIRSQCHI